MRTAWLFTVMPRSRSMSIRSRYWARMARSSTIPVICSIRSASVDLPWSMWAMMQKLRSRSWGVDAGAMSRASSAAILGVTGIRPLVDGVPGAHAPGIGPWSHVPHAPRRPADGRRADVTARPTGSPGRAPVPEEGTGPGRSPPVGLPRARQALTSPRHTAGEGEGQRSGRAGVEAVHRLHVHVRLHAVAGVPAPGEHLPRRDTLSDAHGDAALLQMAQDRERRPAAAGDLEDDVVPGESLPAPAQATPLRARVEHRRQTAMGAMVGVPVVDVPDGPVGRGQHLQAEAGEVLRRLGQQ